MFVEGVDVEGVEVGVKVEVVGIVVGRCRSSRSREVVVVLFWREVLEVVVVFG